LRAAAVEVVELNPAAVKQARSQQLLRRLKSDERDLGAMAELLVRGAGRQPAVRDEAMATQAAWIGHRRRKVTARVALANQVRGHLDLLFPGLSACFSGILHTKAGMVVVRDRADPDRMRRLGVEGLRRFVARRGVILHRAKAEQLVAAAAVARPLPAAERAPIGALLAVDVALLDVLGTKIARAEAALAEVIDATPAGVLTSLPGVGVVRASAYDAAIRDPWRFPNAGAAYRASGLVPAEYSSARRGRGVQRITPNRSQQAEGSTRVACAPICAGAGVGCVRFGAGSRATSSACRGRGRTQAGAPATAWASMASRIDWSGASKGSAWGTAASEPRKKSSMSPGAGGRCPLSTIVGLTRRIPSRTPA